MKKILAVTPDDAAGGFAIAGVAQQQAAPPAMAALLAATLADDEAGVVAIDERLVDAALHDRLRDLERRSSAAVVVLPAPGRPSRPEDDYAGRLIRRAIGHQVKVQL